LSFEEYIAKNNEELIEITRNITKNHTDTLELYQFVILQLLTKPPKKDIPDKQKKYFFVRVVKNNWFSKTSRYEYEVRRKLYHKDTYDEFNYETYEELETDLTEQPTIEWVREELNTMGWYKRDLFSLWTELQNITELSKQTTIPVGTCGKQIRDIKEELNRRWELYISRCL
jgi:DNA-directed RNA polymerase specialized sigma24 family protein